MAQAVWTGTISFGLVNIPVKLYPATEPKDVRFHLYDRLTGKRVRYERVVRDEEAPTFEPEPAAVSPAADGRSAPDPAGRADEAEWAASAAARSIEREDVVRGVTLPTGDLVTVTDEELVSIAPERSRTIEIEEFVDLAEIDPVYFEKSYYVAPMYGMGAEKPYALLHGAMRAAGMVGIGRFVLRTKPHLVAIRPLKDALALETLFFGDEVRAPREVISGPSNVAISDRELKTARQLIAALATEWVPEKHGDRYREELLAMLRSKPPSAPAEVVETAGAAVVGDLMAALRASVEAAKRRTKGKGAASKRAG